MRQSESFHSVVREIFRKKVTFWRGNLKKKAMFSWNSRKYFFAIKWSFHRICFKKKWYFGGILEGNIYKKKLTFSWFCFWKNKVTFSRNFQGFPPIFVLEKDRFSWNFEVKLKIGNLKKTNKQYLIYLGTCRKFKDITKKEKLLKKKVQPYRLIKWKLLCNTHYQYQWASNL